MFGSNSLLPLSLSVPATHLEDVELLTNQLEQTIAELPDATDLGHVDSPQGLINLRTFLILSILVMPKGWHYYECQ